MVDSERRDPDELLAAVQARGSARAARAAQDFLRRIRRRRQDLCHARSGARGAATASTSWSATSSRTAASKPRSYSKAWSSLPFLQVRYRGITRREFDLDARSAARARRRCWSMSSPIPTSSKGNREPRHAKRWQDIEELLDAGINVWTTLNIQHLESLNDVVAGITGVQQQETIPDRIFDEADEVELIDLPPDDLLAAAARPGKYTCRSRAATATERFFRKPNLLALRELALAPHGRPRRCRRARLWRAASGSRPWLARDRFLIAVAPNDQAEQLVRFGKRFADALDAEWLVVSVETLRCCDSVRLRAIGASRYCASPSPWAPRR